MQRLGGSIFPEDYCGDLEAVEEQLEEEDRQVRLCKAVLHAIQGNIKKAKSVLKALSELPNLPCHWALRCASFSAFFTYLRRYPPLLRFRPELGGLWDDTRMHELNYKTVNEHLLQNIEAYVKSRAELEDVYSFEARIIYRLLATPIKLWLGAFGQHPVYPVKIPAGEAIANVGLHVEDFRKIAEDLEWVRLENFARRLQLELLSGSKLPQDETNLEHAIQQCDQQNDQLGMALIKMMKADHLLSPPFSNPIALNLVPIDSDNPSNSNARWDTTEDFLQLRSSTEAQALYQESIQAFENARAPRGQAAVFLRQGCIEHMEAISQDGGSGQETLRKLQSVAEIFEKAAGLFGRDEPSIQLVKGHQLLLNISSGVTEGILEQAASLGRWGLENENEGIPHFIGWLMMRFGRRQEIERARMDVALSCYRSARRCFQELNDHYAAFQAHVAEMQLQTDWYSYTNARSMVEDQLTEFYSIVAKLERLADDPDRQTANYPLVRQNLVTVYGSLVSQIYRNRSDADGLGKWIKKRQELNNYEKGKVALETAARSKRDMIKGQMPEESLYDIIEWEQRDQRLADKYHAANSTYNSQLRNANLLEAERTLKDFANAAKSENASSYITRVLRILAYFQLGEYQQCKGILDEMEDSELLDMQMVEVPCVEAIWWRCRYSTKVSNVQMAENAIAFCAMSHDWDRGNRLLQKILKLSPGFMEVDCATPSCDPWNRFGWAGMVAEHTDQLATAFRWLLEAAKHVEVRRARGIDLEARRGLYSPLPVAEIFAGLARICLKYQDAQIPIAALDGHSHAHDSDLSWPEHALLFLEQANARCLLDSLASQGPKMPDDTDPTVKLYARRRRAELLAHPESGRGSESALNPDSEYILELQELDEVLQGHGVYPELNSSIFPQAHPQFHTRNLYDSIGNGAVALEVSFSRSGCALFAITESGIQFSKYSSIRDIDVRRHVIHVMNEVKIYKSLDKGSPRDSLDCSLEKIAQILLNPIQEILDSQSRVIFVISQPMTAFPFATLPFRGRPLCLQKAISQVPSLSTLLNLVDLKPAYPSPLCIAKANGEKINGFTLEKSLPMAGIEAVTTASRFHAEVKEGSELDRTTFRQLVKQNNILLLGTHGFLSPHSPWLSYVSLKQNFRVLDLFEIKSQAALIIFSACVSGLGTATMTNDVMGFTHAVLSTGSKAFIGSLWEVNDIATMFLITTFFRLLHQIREPTRLDELWTQSQRELYELNDEKAINLLEELIELWEKAESDGVFDPNSVLPEGEVSLWELREMVENKELNLDFKHPYMYASLTLAGCGSTLFQPSGAV